MYSVKVYGAGSIGNHLTNAFRSKGFDVILTDISQEALDRAKNKIYPERYGNWDSKIDLHLSKDVSKVSCDIVFIGTPPEYHVEIALKELENNPKLILIEKPLCEPNMNDLDILYEKSKKINTKILVGYNHIVSKASLKLKDYLSESIIGKVQTISSYTREHWGGIFGAHPWLDGPKDSYLGYYQKGGGALCEHSHGLNMWQHLSHSLGMGRVTEVNATLDFYSDGTVNYDKNAIVSLKNESGIIGDLIQDVITYPTIKKSKVQGDKNYIEIELSKNNTDILRYHKNNKVEEIIFTKSRPDDFIWEVEHIISVLENPNINSPISLERGIETMLVIEAIFKSSKSNKPINVNYNKILN